jgi:predicted regulator of Ras-like GTPase activity (Roadblock/LC7/MglB family)
MAQWTLFEKDFRAIDQQLNGLLERTNALSVHLVDRSGQLITTAGRSSDFDTVAFASIAAADFTANAELSAMLGDPGLEAVVAQGTQRTVYSQLVAGRVIMCTVFDRRSTLGLVRFRAKRVGAELDAIFRALFDKVGLAPEPAPGLEPGRFAAEAAREVDALFGE